jgi:hypothetical protein
MLTRLAIILVLVAALIGCTPGTSPSPVITNSSPGGLETPSGAPSPSDEASPSDELMSTEPTSS